MRENREIVARVRAARRDSRAADELVRSYLPFIKAETAKFMGRPPQEGRDDELGIAMYAFHEAVMTYDRARGAFIPLAALSIRNRLIDFRRRESRHAEVVSLDERRPASDDEDDRPLVETLAAEKDEISERETRLASRAEIAEFASQLRDFGITLFDVTESCPQQRRNRHLPRHPPPHHDPIQEIPFLPSEKEVQSPRDRDPSRPRDIPQKKICSNGSNKNP